MSSVSDKELQDARARFVAILNEERAKVGLPPQAAQVVVKPVDEYMERWKAQAAGDQTQAFIRFNEERIARGESPLNARGEPIGPAAPLVVPALPSVVPDDDFFASKSGGVKTAKRY